MSVELSEVTNAVAEFDRVAAGLAELQSKYKGVIYDVTTTKGMTEAKEARRAVREPRIEVEKIRKSAKAPILALGKKLDSEAARITKALEELECPIDDQIKAEETRKEQEKQAKIEAELKRIQTLQERVAELRGNRTLSAQSGSALIAGHISDLEKLPVDDSFQEFKQSAEDAKAAGLSWLRELHSAALAHEAEQKRIREEREELARLKAEQAQREAAERDRKAEEDRRAQEQRDREAAEQRRVSALSDRLADLKAQGTIPGDWPASKIEAQFKLVEGVSADSSVWQEFTAEATTARMEVLASLQSLHAAALRREAEEKRLRDQQAELDRKQREQEQRQADIDRREREQREAEERQRQEAAAAEARRLAAEQAERDRKDREAAENRTREERRQKALENPPPAMDIVKTVAEGYGVELDIAMEWLTTLDFSDLTESEAA